MAESTSTFDFLIRVSERVDQPGFVVELQDTTVEGREMKIATDSFEEAEALAMSIKRYVELGCPVGPLFGEDVTQ